MKPVEKCIVCHEELLRAEIAPGLKALSCPQRHGIWLSLETYQDWVVRQIEVPAFDGPLKVEDRSRAASCPCCGHLMERCRVSTRFDFHVDRCNACYGIWLDAGEWTALVALKQATHLVQVLSEQGQRQIREQLAHEKVDAQWREKLGEESFAEACRIKAWIKQHPRKEMLMAYIGSPR